MRIYVIHPGATFSTSDVYDGVVYGLDANGCEVYEGRIDSVLGWYDVAVSVGLRAGVWRADAITDNEYFGRVRFASAHITQHILDVRPDLVLCVSGHNYHVRDIAIVKRAGIPLACLMTEAPYFFDFECVLAQLYDVVFTNERQCVDAFQRINRRAFHLPHAYHPVRHTPGGTRAAPCDVFFVGSWFEERMALLNGVDWYGIDFVWRGHDLSDTPSEIMPNEDAAAHYRSARVSINMHRTTTSVGDRQHIAPGTAESLNPRAYEIAACGGLQLMDDSRSEARDVFGEALLTYRAGDSADLEAQVRRILADPERYEPVRRAQHEAVLPHSWVNRAAQLLEVLA
jgi:spore maturation protein CgeB